MSVAHNDGALFSLIAHVLLFTGLLVAVAAGLFAGAGLVRHAGRRSTTRRRARETRARRHHYQQVFLLSLSAAALTALCLVAIQDIPSLRYARPPDHITTALDRVKHIEECLIDTQATAAILHQAAVTIEDKLDRTLSACSTTTSPDHLQLRQLGFIPAFPGGRATCDDLPADAAAIVTRMAHEIAEIATNASVHGVYVVGGHDVRPLGADTRAIYDSNGVLAFRRAACVTRALRKELALTLPDTPIIPTIGGPEHLGPHPDAALLEADRRTAVLLLSAPRRTAADVPTEVSDARP